jgi:hypothetical protein
MSKPSMRKVRLNTLSRPSKFSNATVNLPENLFTSMVSLLKVVDQLRECPLTLRMLKSLVSISI